MTIGAADISELELDRFPAVRRLAASLAPDRVDDLPLVQTRDLGGGLRDLCRDLRRAAEKAERNQRPIRSLRGVHLIRRPILVLGVYRAQNDHHCRGGELRTVLFLHRFLAAALRSVIRDAAVQIEEIGGALHVLEHAVIVRITREAVCNEHADRLLGGHGRTPECGLTSRPYYRGYGFATKRILQSAHAQSISGVTKFRSNAGALRYTNRRDALASLQHS